MNKTDKTQGIYIKDLTKDTSVLLEEVRDQLTLMRGHLHDIKFNKGWGDRVEPVEGLLTCGISYLYHTIQEIKEYEIKLEDREFGESYHFGLRGIGSDSCPGCFVCGSANQTSTLMSNISGFVKSKEEGEIIVSWFKSGARLDYRPYEPNWIQVKIGACTTHLPNLEKLASLTRKYYRIRYQMILDSLR